MRKTELQKGFTLIELMIVVAIIGILSSIVIPNYSEYVKSGKAAEATSTLADRRIKMEQFYQDNRTYIGGPCEPPAATAQFFDYECQVTASTYTITATGDGSEGMDNFEYTIDQDNNKASKIGETVANGCWITKKGGSC